jgi:hypothetical protein
MARMTNAEADALDAHYTENTIMPLAGKPGLFAQQKAHMVAVDEVSAQYLMSKAEAEHTTVSDVIRELVSRELAAT